jgi:hypothetical protein
MKNVLLAFVLASLVLPAARADDWLRADIYFIDWEVATRVALTPERVRQLANYKQTFINNAPAVRQLLELQKLKSSRDKRQEDARVVIDYTNDDTRRYTIYLSRFNLCTGDNGFKYPINEQFRQRISRLAKKRTTR